MIARSKLLPLLVVLGCLLAVPAVASAATLSVDDDGAQCPAAEFETIQSAINAASPGDTVAVCPGTYVEGTGLPGTDALEITKNVTIKGAGADLVAIEPKRSTPTGGQIAESRMDIRNGKGDIIAAVGGSAVPITVDISGVTVAGNGVFAEAGVVYVDAQGSMVRDRVTGIATSISNTAYELPGGYRSNQYGYGIAQVTAAESSLNSTPRPLVIDHTRVDTYNKIGILIDGATGSALPLTSSGVVNVGELESDQVIGRVQCLTFNTPKPPPYVLGGAGATPPLELPGNCETVTLTRTGPTFGQDGVRVTGGAKVAIKDSTIAQNLVNGEAAPFYSHKETIRNPMTNKNETITVIETANNANLSMGAGIRLIGAGASSITRSNITDNAYDVYNAKLDGSTANTTTPFEAFQNWWGLRVDATSNPGPAVSPTTNPWYQEGAVNGAASTEGSEAVHFKPYREGSNSDPNTGEWPVVYAPLPVNDAPPTVTLTTEKAEYDRGETVNLTANATDDFGVTSITFYSGSEAIGTVTPPADTATFAIPATAACASQTFTAVASDFLYQTASSSAEINVVGPDECKEPEHKEETTPVVPKAPTVSLLSPPATIAPAGVTVSASAGADTAAGRTVAKVEFFLGNRLVCTVTAAPYSCQILPEGSEVGTQSLRAVVTDSGGTTATAEASTKVEKFTAKSLTLSVKSEKAKKGKVKRKLTGELKLPSGVTPAQGCTSGTVSVTVKQGSKTVLPSTQVSLTKKCTYTLALTAKKKQGSKFNATAKFGGNAVLLPASTNRRFN